MESEDQESESQHVLVLRRAQSRHSRYHDLNPRKLRSLKEILGIVVVATHVAEDLKGPSFLVSADSILRGVKEERGDLIEVMGEDSAQELIGLLLQEWKEEEVGV